MPFVVSNIDTSLTPDLANLYQSSVVLEVRNTSLEMEAFKVFSSNVCLQVGGRKVGVVGYLTPETLEVSKRMPTLSSKKHPSPIMTTLIKVSNPGALIIKDELEPVAKEVARLEAEGVDIIIGLGHR